MINEYYLKRYCCGDVTEINEIIEDIIEIFINEGITDKEELIYAVTYELAKNGWEVYQLYDDWFANRDNELTITITGHINAYFDKHNIRNIGDIQMIDEKTKNYIHALSDMFLNENMT